MFATANHDLAWEVLDTAVAWDAATGRPVSFLDGPAEARLEAYRRGIDLVEAASPCAACLCSMHYASFFAQEAGGPLAAFVEAERTRQARLRAAMTPERGAALAGALTVLRFCDDLSLFICRNAPGRSDVPQYRGGIPLGAGRVAARWRGPEELQLDPNPLAGPLSLAITPGAAVRGPAPSRSSRRCA